MWIFREVINIPDLVAINTWLPSWSNDTSKREATITIYAELANHLLSCYSSEVDIAKTDEKICFSKQRSLTPWNPSEELSDLIWQCDSVYNKHMLWEFLIDGVDCIIHSAVRRWSADSNEVTLEVLADQAQFLLGLQGCQRKSAAKEEG